MFASFQSKLDKLKHMDDNVKILYIYRYISLIFISAFFLFFSNGSTYSLKLIMVSCLTITSIILSYLYIIAKNFKPAIISLILIETIGNILILIPTGGLKSPYIWYAINTVLVTLIFLNIRYCITNLSIYILSSIALSQFINKSIGTNLKHLILDNSNFILGIILATVVAELLLRTQRELKKEKGNLISANSELNSLNKRLNELIVNITSLYQALHTLTNESDKSKIIKLLLSYTKSMMKTDTSFFCEQLDSGLWKVQIDGSNSKDFENSIIKAIDEQWKIIKYSDSDVDFQIGEMKAIVKSVKSSYSTYGVVGFKVNKQDSSKSYEEHNQQLYFLALFGAMALERVDLEKTSRRFLINDEQNRIAGEMHDSVCQRLFAVSCSIQAMLHNKEFTLLPEFRQELNLVKDSIHKANRELRETIYGMSSKKRGVNIFFEDISNYINDISRLYNVHAELQINGNQDILSHNLKNAIYRVVCEGVGNALRHSGCSIVVIDIDIKDNFTKLLITDNGVGFDFNKNTNNKSGGLGIRNMYSLIHLYRGEINIESQYQKGTVIKIILPNCRNEKEEAV